MAVRRYWAAPDVLKVCVVVVFIGAIGEGLLFFGYFDGFPDSVLAVFGLLFAIVGLILLLGFPIVMYRRYGFFSALAVFLLALFFSAVTTALSLELPGWILVLGFWPVIGFLYLGTVAVEYALRDGFPQKR